MPKSFSKYWWLIMANEFGQLEMDLLGINRLKDAKEAAVKAQYCLKRAKQSTDD